MKRSYLTTKLDLEAFAREGASLSGEWPAAGLTRLAESGAADAPATAWPSVRWSLQGELRQPRGAKAQTWLHLQAQAEVELTCQRCLHAYRQELVVDRWLRFVDEETEAAALDIDSDDDVLALERHLDARELIEDELLLALPIVPRHDTCPKPLIAPAQEAAAAEPVRPNPFAALAALKGQPGDD